MEAIRERRFLYLYQEKCAIHLLIHGINTCVHGYIIQVKKRFDILLGNLLL